ncbi:MAG: glycoside hydrolase family 2, partial [Clostridia bacterium]|nr:glycoside hydrolase family 2 [Clostridia bacterium]
MDFFGSIAAKGIGGRQELLCKNEPIKHEKRATLLDKKAEPIFTKEKISTMEELYSELKGMREHYAPFLENHAPKIEALTEKIELKNFTLDGEKITLPHYSGPAGYAKQVYETSFTIDKLSSEKAYYVSFSGADYRAVVYLNGTCVGIHEGFFAPFSFNIDKEIKKGENKLKIELYNDYIYMGNAPLGKPRCEGDKLYAATGLGWDDANFGWHHCPPGMGIYGEVSLEIKNRISLSDVFVRQDEICVEVHNEDYEEREIELRYSLYGRNFKECVFENKSYTPSTLRTVGMGDTLTQSQVADKLNKGFSLPAKKGANTYRIPYDSKDLRLWTQSEPYLYELVVELISDGAVFDRISTHFGNRSFTQDTKSSPKGMFYLNGEKIKLRGANTMGFEQQDVLRGDLEQLIDDILLSKLCNMNFLRFTQRPVDKVIYDYCDMLGMLAQTDLPLFGCMRRTKFAEGVRQAEEMERIIRNHPSAVIISYINEPFPNASNEPHRHLERRELESFFSACDLAVKILNPDRVIKHVDGDYDPPSETMPDNHCYPMWYNGHGIDIGLLNKGYWLPTRPDWYYGCGEFGAEGLDFADLMKRRYPKEWLSEPFNPGNIVNAQTENFHYFFFDDGESLEDWVKKSQAHQSFATRIMTEAFRRDRRMVSFAIHLFIDAWPSGWMKTIMDCERRPKPAYFEYRNALEPILVSLRTDRFAYFDGEELSVEAFVANDTAKSGKYTLVYECDGMSAKAEFKLAACDVTYVSNPTLKLSAKTRKTLTLKAILLDE